MENKINIAELLKDCPKGMELDCAMWNDVVLESIEPGNYPVKIRIKGGEDITADFTEFGEWNYNNNSKCVIFPKGKTTWEGFVSPYKYKNGDIVITALGSTAIIKESISSTGYSAHCVWICGKLITDDTIDAIRFARESEKAELFKAIKDNGFKWDEETKTLEKLIEPRFKVGDRVYNKNYKDYIYDIHDIVDKGYRAKEINADYPILILFGSQEDNYELVPNKFDINTLVPFESKVLMRDYNNSIWLPALWGIYNDNDNSDYPYKLVGTMCRYCIPYEGNEYLLGTTNDCDEYYKTWN